MLILTYLGDPPKLLAMLAALVLGFTCHEYAHARVAFRLGDYTAYSQGRLTLDPRRHVDPVGMLMFLVAGFGWARPVPIDPFRLGRRGTLEVSLAGPAANLLLALAAALPLRLVPGLVDGPIGVFLITFATFNIVLAVFNLLPIPPLDGWKVLLGIVPANLADRLDRVAPYGFMLLFGLIILGRVGGFSVLDTLVQPVLAVFAWFVLGGQT